MKKIVITLIILILLVIPNSIFAIEEVVISREKQMVCPNCSIKDEANKDNFRNLKWGSPPP